MKKETLGKIMEKIQEDIIAIGSCQLDCQEPEYSQAQKIIDFYWSVFDEFEKQLHDCSYRINQTLLKKYYNSLSLEYFSAKRGLRVL